MILIKALFFFAFLIGLGWLVQNASQTPGSVIFNWYGYEVETSALFIVVCIFTLTVFFFVWGRIWSWFMAAPKNLAIIRDKKREKQGFEAFFKGMDALAAGDAKKAKSLALKTSKLLPDQRLPHMIRAEASQLLGDENEAVYHFKALAENKDSAFLGLRGLLSQSFKAKRYTEAYTYAEKVYKLKPQSPWVLRIYFEILIHLQKFEEALKFLTKLDKKAILSFEESSRHRGFIAFQLAKEYLKQNNYKKALKYTNLGLKALPSFVELGELKIDVYQQQDKPLKVVKSLVDLWQNAPSKNTFTTWLTATDGNKNQLKQAKKITSKHTETAEGCIALGLAYKANNDFIQSEKYFEKALKYTQNQYIYAQLLICTQKQNKEAKTQEKWQNKAISSHSYQWNLEDYYTEHKKWCETYLDNSQNEQLQSNLRSI